MRRNLVQSLFEHGKVRTTLPKALEVKAMAERLITLARTGTLTARRKVISELQDRRLTDDEQEFTGVTVIQKLFNEIGPQFVNRPGGYTRIIKLSDFRIGDAASVVLLQLLLEEENVPRGTIRRSAGLRRKRNERRHQFAARALKQRQAKREGEAQSGTSTSTATATEPEAGETPTA
jgi:large subunit ribosomal protein L17